MGVVDGWSDCVIEYIWSIGEVIILATEAYDPEDGVVIGDIEVGRVDLDIIDGGDCIGEVLRVGHEDV